jgi:hypothetical protein
MVQKKALKLVEDSVSYLVKQMVFEKDYLMEQRWDGSGCDGTYVWLGCVRKDSHLSPSNDKYRYNDQCW